MRRARKINWRAAKLALVATRRVGVGPGVKMLFQRSLKKDAMLARYGKRSAISYGDGKVVSARVKGVDSTGLGALRVVISGGGVNVA